MSIITKIVCQTKNPDRVNLFIDGEFSCALSKILVFQQHLFETKEIDEKELKKLIFESDKNIAFDYALTYIARYTPTKYQLSQKLFDKGYGAEVVAIVIEKAVGYGYIDDVEYIRCYLAYNSAMKGKNRLRQDLLSKHIDKNIIDKALSTLEVDEDNILTLAQKHSRGKDINDQKYKARLVRYLQYRGYGWEEISSCINRLKSDTTNINGDEFE